MIESAIAVRFDGYVEQGRTGPLRVHVETSGGEYIDVILKVAGPQLPIEGLANEMLGSLLAGDLNIPTPQPYFVELLPDFIESVGDIPLRARLAGTCPLAFGSRDVGSQWRKWNGTDHLDANTLDLALKILAFDAIIGNPDRSPRNPNLLRCKNDHRMVVIDHECAFGFRMKLFPPVRPWQLGNLSPLAQRGTDSEHLFQLPLAGRAGLAFDAIKEDWDGLSDVRFGAYDALLPDAWNGARPAISDALGHFRAVRENLPSCITELTRILA
ncbi:hypothetical protein BH10PSE3_BH10PSE3_37850 [soil metagenome]